MLRSYSSATALIALGALLGSAAMPASAADNSPAQQNAGPAPEQGSNPAARQQGAAKFDPVFVNGALNVPGAPADSQTRPAKFSKRNDAIDKTPIMAMPLALSDAQKRKIVDAVRLASAPVAATRAKPAEELPLDVAVHDLPASAADPALAKLKYVRTADRILLVDPPNRIVVGEIAN